jgi:hypothetical protein
MEDRKHNAFIIVIEGSPTEPFMEALQSLGECVTLWSTLYVIVTENSDSEILLALDPLKHPSIRGLFIMKSTDLVWTFLPVQSAISDIKPPQELLW